MDSDDATTPSVLIFDLEEVEARRDAKPCQGSCQLLRSLTVLSFSQTHFEARLLQDTRSYKQRLVREDVSLDIVVLAAHLAAIGYKVAIRRAVGGGVGQECFHNLQYEFLLVTDENSTAEVIVDPRFREQFHISQSTPDYRALLDCTPEEYVGSSARLRPMIKLLCGEMQQAFETLGLTCPPWRRSDSMTSKWLPTKARDTEVATPSSSPEGRYGKSLIGMSPRGPLSRSNSDAMSSPTSSSRSSFSLHGPPSAFKDKPLVRQAGFKPCVAQGLLGSQQVIQATEDIELRTQLSARLKGRENWKTTVGRSLLEGSATPQTSRQSPKSVQQPQNNLESSWYAPRIRTVRMTGEWGR